MAKVKAIKMGYYNHRRIKPGDIFNMSEVDEKGCYLEGKFKGQKCKWVGHVKSKVDQAIDPKKLVAAISGKNPGKQKEDDSFVIEREAD